MKPLTNNHPYIYQNYQVGIFRSFFCLRLSARKVNSIGRLFTNNTKPLFPARISLCKLAPAPFTLRSSLLCRSCWSQTSGRTDGQTVCSADSALKASDTCAEFVEAPPKPRRRRRRLPPTPTPTHARPSVRPSSITVPQ